MTDTKTETRKFTYETEALDVVKGIDLSNKV